MESMNGGEDRISQIPDAVLHSILSRIPTRSAFPTRQLSKRWKQLWASMPYFDVRDCSTGETAVPNFVGFVDRLLRLCDKSDIHKFHLRLSPLLKSSGTVGLEQQHLSKWIGQLAGRNVKILEVEALLGEDVELPSCLFTCRPLEELKLSFDGFRAKLTTPQLFGVGLLRKLCLWHVVVGCDLLKQLISGCHLLEDLDMTLCELDGLDISSDSLLTFGICECKITGSMIWISSPRARKMLFLDNKVSSPEVSWGSLSSLVDASIQVDNSGADRNLKPLKFVTSSNKNLSGNSALQEFSNLKKLTLCGLTVDKSFPAVAYFLERSPNLEELVLTGAYDPVEHFYRECNYSCVHFKRKILFDCGSENYSVIRKMEKYLHSKCYCHSKMILSSKRYF